LIDGVEEDTRKLGFRDWGWKRRVEVAGDICLRRPRPTQGCRADDDYDDQHPSNKVENIYALASSGLFTY